MKRFLIFHLTFLIWFLNVDGQNITNPNPGNFGTQAQRWWLDSALYIPTFSTQPHDTLDLHSQGFNGGGMKSVAAALYFDKVGHILYVWDPALQQWIAAGAPGIYFGDETTIHLTTSTSTFSIAANYHGQSSITTVGTITGGVWQSTPITDAYISSSAIWNAKLSGALPSGDIFVGNASGIATPQAMSGDATLNNTGILTLASVITGGSCTNCNLTYDAKGRITIAGNGTGGAGGAAPFYDSGAIIKNFADATRKIILNASLITTGTTRTLYSPNTSGILAVVDGINGRLTYKAADGKIYTLPVVYDSANVVPNVNINTALFLTPATTPIIPLDTANNKLLVMNAAGRVQRMTWQQIVGILGVDTLFVDEPGAGPGAIQLAFTRAGHLIIPKWAPGTGIAFSIGPDSLVTINATGGGGSGTTIYTGDGQLLGPRIVDGNSNTLTFRRIADPIISMQSAISGNGGRFTLVDSGKDGQLTIGNNNTSGGGIKSGFEIDMWGIANGGPGGSSPYSSFFLDSGRTELTDQFGNYMLFASASFGQPGITFNPAGGNFSVYGLPSTTDSINTRILVYDPVFQTFKYLNHWPTGGGGGGGGTEGLDDVLAVNQTLLAGHTSNLSSFTWEMDGSGQPILKLVQSGAFTGLHVDALASGGVGVDAHVTNGTAINAVATNGLAISANATTGTAIQGQTSAGGAVGILLADDASTNSVLPVLFIERSTSGTAAAGIGGSIRFATETTTGFVGTGDIQNVLADANTATATSVFNFRLINNAGTLTTIMTIDPLGGVIAQGASAGGQFTGSVVGFFGSSPSLPLQLNNTSTTNNAVVNAANFTRQGSYTATIGAGLGISFSQVNGSGAVFNSGSIANVVSIATSGAEKTDWVFKASDGSGGINNIFSIVGGTRSIRLLQMGSVVNAANNAAAITAGLTTGDVYRNGDALQVVH